MLMNGVHICSLHPEGGTRWSREVELYLVQAVPLAYAPVVSDCGTLTDIDPAAHQCRVTSVWL